MHGEQNIKKSIFKYVLQLLMLRLIVVILCIVTGHKFYVLLRKLQIHKCQKLKRF